MIRLIRMNIWGVSLNDVRILGDFAFGIVICCDILTQWQLNEPDGDARHDVSNGVLSDGVVRQP